MTYVQKVLANRSTELVAEIDAALVTANGWTKVGSTYTSPTVDGRTLSFTMTDTALYTQFVLPTKNGANKTLYMYHGTASNVAQCDLTIHAGPDFFYINTKGPNPGQSNAWNATYGSPRTYFGLFPLVAYHPADTAKSYVAVGSVTSGSAPTGDRDVFVDIGLNGVGWQPARLGTIRPAIQDDVGSGDSFQTRRALGVTPLWPFLVVENQAGLRGRLNYCYFASEGYAQTGDNTEGLFTNGQRYTIDGAIHRTHRAFLYPGTSTAYSAFGTVGLNVYSNVANDGGPIIAVKE